MRVLVCGSKRWTDGEAIRRELEQLPTDTVLIHGDNGYDARGRGLWGEPDELAVRGADKLAGAIGTSLGFIVERYTPDWQRHGPKAGPIRNSRMLREGKPELVIAFASDLERSTGTRDMVHKAQKAGIPTRLIGGGER